MKAIRLPLKNMFKTLLNIPVKIRSESDLKT